MFNNRINIAHPELSLYNPEQDAINASLQPIYSTTEKLTGVGLNSKGIEKILRNLLPQIWDIIPETLSQEIASQLHLPSRKKALKEIHFPSSEVALQKAQIRLKFEELFLMQLQILRTQLSHKSKFKGLIFNQVGSYFNEFYNHHLPFSLTNAQKRVVKEIRKDMGSGAQMNRLLQGDVGSGKTVVALLCALIALDNGFQSAVMAPTEILAQQHFESFIQLLKDMKVRVTILTGSTKTAKRREILTDLKEGETDIIIGTHALLEDRVEFKNLGLAIIDEQHRFGVAQRARLWKKNAQPPHILVMTATPIPRTLSMTLYGDLDVSLIDELPPGRKPVKTVHRYDSSRLSVFQFVREQIALGRQVYVVYPLIQESETLDYKDLMDGYESITRSFPLPEYQVAIVHGKMKPADKDFEMERFASGKAQILVATTVIEVGVNVPNASVMVIESAERFGLSQLHQLRGRVGRGADQSYCILITGNKVSNEGRKRMEIMTSTTDGFVIAEEDLRLRGPGDMMGTQQSGILDLKLADLSKDQQIVLLARKTASSLLVEDPNLRLEKNAPILRAFQDFLKHRPNWSRIS
jgi:ATP-dependent DNA helicase RecG